MTGPSGYLTQNLGVLISGFLASSTLKFLAKYEPCMYTYIAFTSLDSYVSVYDGFMSSFFLNTSFGVMLFLSLNKSNL